MPSPGILSRKAYSGGKPELPLKPQLKTSRIPSSRPCKAAAIEEEVFITAAAHHRPATAHNGAVRKSEANLLHNNINNNGLAAQPSSNTLQKVKSSALPVATSAGGTMPTVKRTVASSQAPSAGVVLRNKAKPTRNTAAVSNPRLLTLNHNTASSPGTSPRGSLNVSPANSPRSSMYGSLQRASEHRKAKVARSESCNDANVKPQGFQRRTQASQARSAARPSPLAASSSSPVRPSPPPKPSAFQTSTPIQSKPASGLTSASRSRIPNPSPAKSSTSSSSSTSTPAPKKTATGVASRGVTKADAAKSSSTANNTRHQAATKSTGAAGRSRLPRSRPVSRDLDSDLLASAGVACSSSNGSGASSKSGVSSSSVSDLKSPGLENNGFFPACSSSLSNGSALAPTAKFRSDGEISICSDETSLTAKVSSAAASPTKSSSSTSSSSSSVALPHTPRTTAKAARAAEKRGEESKEHVHEHEAEQGKSGSSSSSSDLAKAQQRREQQLPLRPPRGGSKNSTKNADSGNRLSSEVQCWPPWAQDGGGSSSSRNVTRAAAGAAAVTEAAASHKWKSASLDTRLEPPAPLRASGSSAVRQNFLSVRSRSLTFFQRLGGLRRSFSNRSNRTPARAALINNNSCNKTREQQLQRQQQQRQDGKLFHPGDHVFFRGFSGKRVEDLIEPYAVCHGPSLAIACPVSSDGAPVAPPRRRRPKRYSHAEGGEEALYQPLRRSLSFTDAHFIAQAVYEGDAKLIEELYPDFPRSEPIYAVVDKAKKRRNRPATLHDEVKPATNTDSTGRRANRDAAAAASSTAPLSVADDDDDDNNERKSSCANTPRRNNIPPAAGCSGQPSSANSVAVASGGSAAAAPSAAAQVATLLARDCSQIEEGGDTMERRRRKIQSKDSRGRGHRAAGNANGSTTTNAKKKVLRVDENEFGRGMVSQHRPCSPAAGLGEPDAVTFSSSVMFVSQQTENHNNHHRKDLPDLIHDSTPPPPLPPGSSSSAFNPYHAATPTNTPTRRTVTKVSVDSEHQPGGVVAATRMAPLKEASPVISPWHTSRPRPGSTSSNESSSNGGNVSPQNSVLLECDQPTVATAAADLMPWAAVHPFAQRTQMHYLQRHQERLREHQRGGERNDVTITTSRHGGVTLSPSSLTAGSDMAYDPCGTDKGANNKQQQQHSFHNRVSVTVDQPKKHSAPGRISSEHQDTSRAFKRIITKADASLSQAESILSSMKFEQQSPDQVKTADSAHAAMAFLEDTESDSEAQSLGSDIETNIRRLEKTQARIDAALKTFRTVQAMSTHTTSSNKANTIHSHVQQHHSMAYSSLPAHHPHHRHHQVGSRLQQHDAKVAAAAEIKSKTAPAKLEGQASADLENQTNPAAHPVTSFASSSSLTPSGSATGAKPKKTSLFRRHSFSLTGNKEKSPAPSVDSYTSSSQRESVSLWYEGDLDSDAPIAAAAAANRNSAVFDDSYSFSDSEGGFFPLRTRLKGLLGSFGKGKKRRYTGKKREQASINAKQSEEPTTSTDLQSKSNTSPILKATLGEFTRQIESLSARRESDEPLTLSRQTSLPTTSTPYYTPQVSLEASSHQCHHSQEEFSLQQPRLGRQSRKDTLKKADSNDTYVSASSFHGLSNRNSVISSQSASSESYEQEEEHRLRKHDDEEDEEGGRTTESHGSQQDSNSSPRSANDDLTPEQRHEKKVYYIAREIMTSERVFVDILRLLNVEFRDFVQRARRESKHGIIGDADFSRIFSNLPELQALNEDLLQDFEDRIENWHALKKIADVIVRKGPFLKLYTTYIREFSSVNYHFDECCQKFPKFGKLVREFEKKERCRSLKLKHFMLKPVQRLPQYKLLLEDYLRHLDQNSPDFDDTTNALRIVSEAAEHANDTIKQGDKFRKMLKLQSRLGDTELIRPGRELVKEGELQKISRKGVGPRYFVLLSDYLLYCTYGGNWGSSSHSEPSLRVTYKIPLTTLQVRAPNSDDFQTEFNITSPTRSCTLRAATLHERNEWLEALNSAIEEHISRKATFNAAAGANAQTLTYNPTEAAKLGNSAPVWIPDRRVTMCQNCTVEFSVLVRRHHCRACGKVVCASCSANKAPLRYREFDAARVCDECFEVLEKELSHIDALRPRFKKRDTSKNPKDRYVPQRLKVSANGDGAQMCGYLKKRLKNSKWKRMWFVLKDRVLYAYKASEDTLAVETFPILGYDLDTLSEKNFELYEGEYAGLVFILSHPGGESLVFCAENDNICEKWMAALREAIKLDGGEETGSNTRNNT